ncbi:hypothetical protein LWHH1689_1893 [Limosilactobacillus reuteri]|uniref:Uncharacterized protein n=1 Tax=Limosilactobacillus reuteri TaxID=1598 RepID=A0A2S1ET87_LIMRT|nr:hypothetical protein LWHH1689_1893 [Limosilactobacillus reuteri]
MVTPLKTLMGFSVHLNVQLKFYNLPSDKGEKIDVHKTLLVEITIIVIQIGEY